MNMYTQKDPGVGNEEDGIKAVKELLMARNHMARGNPQISVNAVWTAARI